MTTKFKSRHTKKEIISARCDAYAKKILNLLSESEDVSRSEIISRSILEYHRRHFFQDQSLFEKENEFFGKYGSGIGDLSLHRKRYLKETLREKYGRH